MTRLSAITVITLLLWLSSTDNRARAKELPVASSESIGITIMGTIVSKKNGRNVVLVKEINSGKVQAYRAGHSIIKKYKIVEISNEYIIVMKNKSKTKIYQGKFEAARLKIARAKPAFSDYFSEEGFERKGARVKMTTAYRDKIVKQDMAKIMMQATAQPFMKDGVIHGFQLSQIDPGSIYDKGGFRENDVITSINGIDLDSVSGAIKLLNNLKSAEEIDVVLERDGQEQDLTLSIN